MISKKRTGVHLCYRKLEEEGILVKEEEDESLVALTSLMLWIYIAKHKMKNNFFPGQT